MTAGKNRNREKSASTGVSLATIGKEGRMWAPTFSDKTARGSEDDETRLMMCPSEIVPTIFLPERTGIWEHPLFFNTSTHSASVVASWTPRTGEDSHAEALLPLSALPATRAREMAEWVL